jgi:hypothetical protein
MARKIFVIAAASMARKANTEAVRLGLAPGTVAHHPDRPDLNVEKPT